MLRYWAQRLSPWVPLPLPGLSGGNLVPPAFKGLFRVPLPLASTMTDEKHHQKTSKTPAEAC